MTVYLAMLLLAGAASLCLQLLMLSWLRAGHRRNGRLAQQVSNAPAPTGAAAADAAAPSYSLVVCFYQEAPEAIAGLLADIQAQQLPAGQRLEVLLVADRCAAPLLQALTRAAAAGSSPRQQWRLQSVVATAPGWSSRKYALRLGLDAAQGRYLVLTDADCRIGPDFVAGLSAPLQAADVVLGYSPAAPARGLLAAFIGYETAWTAWRYMGWAGWGLPWMGVGRALAFRASLWAASDRFERHRAIASGSDDLWLQGVPPGIRIRALAKPSAQATMPGSWRAWRAQKRRHVSASARYRWPVQLWFLLEALTQVGLYLASLALLLSARAPYVLAALGLLSSLWVLKLVLVRQHSDIFTRPRGLPLPLLDTLYFLYLLAVVAPGLWPGRPSAVRAAWHG